MVSLVIKGPLQGIPHRTLLLGLITLQPSLVDNVPGLTEAATRTQGIEVLHWQVLKRSAAAVGGKTAIALTDLP